MIMDNRKECKDTSSMEFEQRKHKRHFVRNNVFAALRGGFRKVGKINDISLRGLGFSYVRQPGDAHFDCRDSKVDILFPEGGVHLFNIPCWLVYEKTEGASFEGLPIKMTRCGLNFEKVSDLQLDLLNFIITKQTVKSRPKENLSLNYPNDMI